MNTAPLENLDYLLDYKARLYVCATGGGAGFQGHLWNVPGISSMLVGASFPYAPEDTDDFLGFTPENYCCKETAIDLAMKAFYKAYKPGGEPAVGIGLTASVASTRMHRGEHRAIGAYVSENSLNIYNIILQKGTGKDQRIIDGTICDEFIGFLLEQALERPDTGFTRKFNPTSWFHPNKLAQDRFFKYPFFGKDGSRNTEPPKHKFALFPGSFNPPHEGHFGIADEFEKTGIGPVVFNIQTITPHKPDLSIQNMLKRAKTLKSRDVLFSQYLPLYLDKSNKFRNTPMIVGVDTLIRLLDPKWGLDVKDLEMCFNNNGTTFYVVDRIIENKLVTLNDLEIPHGIKCIRLNGKWDVSSTVLREQSI